MKLIIAGSRKFTDLQDDLIDQCIKTIPVTISEVVCGCAKGIDMAGEYWAGLNKVPVKHFHPDYETYTGGRAPLMRNSKMAAYADALLLIWDGQSRGSFDMKNKMKQLNKPIYEIIVKV